VDGAHDTTEGSPDARSVVRSVARVIAAVFLALAALFYLQFAIAATFNSLTQAALTLIGAGALATATFRIIKHQRAAPAVFIGTVPLCIAQIAWSLFVDEPLIFAFASGVAPAAAALIWIFQRHAAIS
jgi:hypothetical protein